MADFSVRELRGLATILDCVLRQTFDLHLEEVQILDANHQLFLASNGNGTATNIRDALHERMRANDFEPMMYMAWVLHARVLNVAPQIANSFQQKLNITNPYGGDPDAWAAQWRNRNLPRALEIEKLAKVVILRKMRENNRFGVLTEQAYKAQVLGYLGIDLNKADARYVNFAVAVAGTNADGVNLQADAEGGGPDIPITRWHDADTASAAIQTGTRLTVYNADDYPHRNDGVFHAEQHLVSLLIDVALRDDQAYEVNIGGKKRPCGTCAPVMQRFINAYGETYGVAVNEPDWEVGAVGGGAGGQLDLPEGLVQEPERAVQFVANWQLPEDNV